MQNYKVRSASLIALQSNTVKGLTSLVGGGQWQDEIGVKVRHTFGMNRVRLWFDPSQRAAQQVAVVDEIALAKADMARQLAYFKQTIKHTWLSLNPALQQPHLLNDEKILTR